MNIFFLDRSPTLAAQYQCDKHIVKMPTESVQMLSTAWHLLCSDRIESYAWPETETGKIKNIHRVGDVRITSKTHHNHPSAMWIRACAANYAWMIEHTHALFREYTHRYGKIHACEKMMRVFEEIPNCLPRTSEQLSPIPQCMPTHCEIVGDSVAAYRNYYIIEKSRFAVWNKSRKAPLWFTRSEVY